MCFRRGRIGPEDDPPYASCMTLLGAGAAARVARR